MPQTIEEQINTIERALGERMIGHALVVVRAWLNELGDTNPYEGRYTHIFERYQALFADWLSAAADEGDNRHDEALDNLTTSAYRLVDNVYAAIRLQRGLSPKIHGFNPESRQSVMNYFANSLTLTESDLQWFADLLRSDSPAMALLAVAALAKNLRECFSEPAMMALIDGIGSPNTVVAEQCLANSLLLLAHYDVRIDFFIDIQTAFGDAISADEGQNAFITLCALIRSVKFNWLEMYSNGELAFSDLPDEVRELVEQTGDENDVTSAIVSFMPSSENEYMAGIVQMIPDTWLYSVLVANNPERMQTIAILYLSIGRMDLMWDNLDIAERWLLNRLREKGKEDPMCYINYGHCLLLQGDRAMAFEYYRSARALCRSAKEFYSLFRPGRRQLVEHGIPLEQVYLLEDQLFES